MKKLFFTITLAALFIFCSFVQAQDRVVVVPLASTTKTITSGVDWDEIVVGNRDVTSAVNVGEVSLEIPANGYVVVRFDGYCIPDVGDRIVLAASKVSQVWAPNDGNVSVEDYASGFSHTRVYEVSAGTQSFYAVAQNYVKTAGNGKASIYGTLTAQYYPNRY